MEQPLRILLIEDSEDDAMLLLYELKKNGYKAIFERVETRRELEAALDTSAWDVITADYSMPSFDGLSALEVLQSRGIDIPFIVVSGKIGEELAAEAMRKGASDYVMKSNLKRLASSIERSMREAENKRLQRQAEEKLQLERKRLGAVTDHLSCALLLVDEDAKIIYSNRLATEWLGEAEALIGRKCGEFLNVVDVEDCPCVVCEAISGGESFTCDLSIKTVAGQTRFVSMSATPVNDGSSEPKQHAVMLIDITERKQVERLNKALNDINVAVNSTLDSGEIMRRVVNEAAKVLTAESSMVVMREDDAWVVRHAFNDISPALGLRFGTDEIPLGISIERLKGFEACTRHIDDASANSEIFRRFEVESVLVIPLIVRGKTTGLVYFNYHRAPASFSDAELSFANKLGITVSLATENARLYAAQHHIAEALQEALLIVPQRIQGVDFGYLYRSATEAAKVGGDFYDIFEFEDGKVGIVIGDVAGKGVRAATLTSLVANTIKAYAYRGLSPTDVIAQINDVVRQAGKEADFVTVFFGILDTATGCLAYCCGGHPPAMIKRSTSEIDLLEENSPIIGAFSSRECEYIEGEERLGRGDILVLYTDGIIEARSSSGEFFGEGRLVEAVSDTKMAEEMPQHIFNAIFEFTEGRLLDDIALMAISLGN